MASTGWLDPGSVTTSAGDYPWTDPDRAEAEDAGYATVALDPAAQSEDLIASDFGSALPGGATVDGVEVRIVRYFEQNGGLAAVVQDASIRLTPGGSPDGDDKANETWTESSPDAFTYGSDTDVWGCTLNPSVVNNTNFGVIVKCVEGSTVDQANAYVDVIQMKITYTEASGFQPAWAANSNVVIQ